MYGRVNIKATVKEFLTLVEDGYTEITVTKSEYEILQNCLPRPEGMTIEEAYKVKVIVDSE